MSERMSEARLKEIQEHNAEARRIHDRLSYRGWTREVGAEAILDRAELLAEVQRLREERTTLDKAAQDQIDLYASETIQAKTELRYTQTRLAIYETGLQGIRDHIESAQSGEAERHHHPCIKAMVEALLKKEAK